MQADAKIRGQKRLMLVNYNQHLFISLIMDIKSHEATEYFGYLRITRVLSQSVS